MAETESRIDPDRLREYVIRSLPELTFMDNIFMTAALSGHPEIIELMLRIILDKDDLKVIKAEVQKTLPNLHGHSVILDVLAEDSRHNLYDIEIQIDSKGAGPKRCRYYGSVMDCNSLKKGMEYSDLTECYVIIITSEDYYKAGLPLYTVNRHIEELGNRPYGDGSHIIYVNGQYKGDTALGKLIHDLKCREPKEMFYPVIRKRAEDLKVKERGVISMCQILQDFIDEEVLRGLEEVRRSQSVANAQTMLKSSSLPIDQIALFSGLTVEEVKAIADEMGGLPV